MANEISITSDMTMKGTTIAVDGKKPKGDLDYIQFSICKRTPMDEMGHIKDPEYDVNATVTYCEKDETTGTEKRVTVNYHNHDEESMEEKYDAEAALNGIMDMIRGNRGRFIKG